MDREAFAKEFELKTKSVTRYVIAGGPNTGKTMTARLLAKELGIKTVRNTDELLDLGWSEASKAVSSWFDEEGDWIVEGVVTPRALRKWMAANPNKSFAKSTKILLLTGPFEEQTTGQKTMTKGMVTVFEAIRKDLTKRGATVTEQINTKSLEREFDAYCERQNKEFHRV